jgi:ribose 5-phosphate isomerase A
MPAKAEGSDAQRRRAAEAALGIVEPGMKLGLGTGRTAEHFVRLLGEKVRGGLNVVGVPTSEKTAMLAETERIPLTTLDEQPSLDLTVDGADEIDPQRRLIKGGGGALLREKIVAAASARMVVVVDEAKLVPVLGAFPLPIEIVSFGRRATILAIEKASASLGLAGELRIRMNGDKPFVTDGGHLIVDASFGRIPDPQALATALAAIPGVVEHGLFIGLASAAIVARGDRVDWL